jgi:Cdc6-like AAA superfamily ATPase
MRFENMSSEKKSIIINLSQPDFSPQGALLQTDALDRLKKFVREQIEEIENIEHHDKCSSDHDDLKLYYHRFHRAVLIEGGRGSGKTTFLLKALKEIRDDQSNGSSLCILRTVDPTLIETKDHIILVILQMIDAVVCKAKCDHRTQTEVDKAREALAGGLALLDGIGPKEPYGNEWEDSTWVMSEGLQKAEKGRLFEEKFNEYINFSLKALNKKAFILSFDDVDTNFGRGYMILEAIRKYLTSPQLFLILSGDLDLYGRLVRKEIYATFGSDVINFDPNITLVSKDILSNAILELEEQYLLKVLPPQYRITMLPLGTLKKDINIFLTKNDDENKLETWVSKKIRKQLREKEVNQVHPFVNVICTQHLRLVLGYLRGLEAVNTDLTDSRRKVLQVFDTRLRAAGLNKLFLQPEMFNHTLRTIFEWFTEHDEPSALIMFRNPETISQALLLHCLALGLADGLEDGGTVLRALFTMALPAAMTKQPVLSGKEKSKEVLNFLWRRGEPYLPDVSARITSISRSSEMRGRLRASVFGSVGVAQSSSIEKKNPGITRIYGISDASDIRSLTFEELKKRSSASINKKWLQILENNDQNKIKPLQNVSWFTIDKILEEDRCGDFGRLLNMLSFCHFNSSNEIQYSISALSLFAAIGEILADSSVSDDNISRLSLEDVIPNFGQATGSKTDDDASEQDDDGDGDDLAGDQTSLNSFSDDEKSNYKKFLSILGDWQVFAAELTDKAALSPSLLGALANRLHDDLLDLDDYMRGGVLTGQILHRQITNILNAIVSVTADLPGRRESPKTSDAPFVRALKRTTPETLHAFSVVLLSCPLVWAFLNPDGTLEQDASRNEKQDASSSDKIVDVVLKALEGWWNKNKQGVAPFEAWTTPPEVKVKIGRTPKNANNQRSVRVAGFYDLLNVVPRYAESVQGKK